MEAPLKRKRPQGHDVDLSHKRARNNLRLKSRFESIFEKYSRDFSGFGDEIDITTGEVVVNNGHLLTMQNEHDIEGHGNEGDELGDGAGEPDGSAAKNGTDVPNSKVVERETRVRLAELDQLSVDPKWRAPPLPFIEVELKDVVEPTVDIRGSGSERSLSPCEISLWADETVCDYEGEVQAQCKWKRHNWTHQEDELLRRMRTTTQLSYRDLESYFPGVQYGQINDRWSKIMVQRGNDHEPTDQSTASLLQRKLASQKRSAELKDDDKLLAKLKEEENLSWKDITARFADLGKSYSSPQLRVRFTRLLRRRKRILLAPKPVRSATIDRSTHQIKKRGSIIELDEEEQLLLKLRVEEDLLWKDVAIRFQTELGKSYQVETLRGRFLRLCKRLRKRVPTTSAQSAGDYRPRPNLAKTTFPVPGCEALRNLHDDTDQGLHDHMNKGISLPSLVVCLPVHLATKSTSDAMSERRSSSRSTRSPAVVHTEGIPALLRPEVAIKPKRMQRSRQYHVSVPYPDPFVSMKESSTDWRASHSSVTDRAEAFQSRILQPSPIKAVPIAGDEGNSNQPSRSNATRTNSTKLAGRPSTPRSGTQKPKTRSETPRQRLSIMSIMDNSSEDELSMIAPDTGKPTTTTTVRLSPRKSHCGSENYRCQRRFCLRCV